MKFTKSLFFVALLCSSISLLAQNQDYPKIGLALSGGGAKGLAHIVVCKALDSAGLNVDYVTGTSMGAIIGSVYATGHTGKEVEEVALSADWGEILSDDVPIRSLSFEEKNVNFESALKIPFSDRGLKLDRSLLEGQGVWLKFTQLLFPVMGTNDFSKLPRPFKCVGTDLVNGQKILLDKGNILESVRASMAIPAVFTPIKIGDTLIVDGGLVRNFPVQTVIDMGADFVIGIDVNHSGRDSIDLLNPLNALLNIGFYNSNKDFETQKPLCNVYFSFDMHEYNTGSFNVVPELMAHCNESLDSLYHIFKNVKDSLDAVYGPNQSPKVQLPNVTSYHFTELRIRGLNSYDMETFKEMINMSFPKNYTQPELEEIVKDAFQTNRFKSIYYNVIDRGNGDYLLEYRVVPKASAFLDVGLQYSSFEGINAIAMVDAYSLISRRSRTQIGGSIGKNYRFRFNHFQPFTKNAKYGLRPYYRYGNIKLLYNNADYETNAQYRQSYSQAGIDIMTLGNRKWQYGIGWQWERVQINPDFYVDNIIDGHGTMYELGGFLNYNYLDRLDFPTKGSAFTIDFGYKYKQIPDFEVTLGDDKYSNLDSLGVKFNPYQKLTLDWDSYYPVSRKGVMRLNFQGFFNFNYQNNFMDNYLVGGLEKTFRNQITFVGVNESGITTSSFGGMLLSYRHQFTPNIYGDLMTNVGTYGFLNNQNKVNFDKNLFGLASSLYYKSLIGSFRFAVSYSPQNNNWATYFYFGKFFL